MNSDSMEPMLEADCVQASERLPFAARLALDMLGRMRHGAVLLRLPGQTPIRLGQGPLIAHWEVRDLDVFGEMFARTDIGLAETWMAGSWDCDDLAALLSWFGCNRENLGEAFYGQMLRVALYRLWRLMRVNTRRGARRNIEAHYDLGNEFYRLWLDESMTYSSALFDVEGLSLAQAQQRKYRRILEQLRAQPGQTILEVGCGWGGFAEVAAREFECRVVGLTLSPAQLAYARERAQRGGYADMVDFRLCDYRDVEGAYDHVVSIEMIEAVGEFYWPTYFRTLQRCLAPGGRCVIQAITIAERHFARYRKGADFIQRYVFPGGMLPSPERVREHATEAGLIVADDLAFGDDYARTLAVWHERFNAEAGAVLAQGFDSRFVRMWQFYLAYCEAGFNADTIDVHHYTLEHACR